MQSRLPILKPFLFRGFLATCALGVTAAQARDLDPETRQFVIVNCMKAKRRELGHGCRSAYDKAVRILSQ
jgi:hypothetical protein